MQMRNNAALIANWGWTRLGRSDLQHTLCIHLFCARERTAGGPTHARILSGGIDDGVNEVVAHTLEVVYRVSFCEIVSQIGLAWLPIDYEMTLFYAILHPMKLHVNRLRTTLLDSLICDAHGD